jgi:hypothetical protein
MCSELGLDIFIKTDVAYSAKLRRFASTMFSYSPRAYEFMRSNIPAPCTSTVRGWLGEFSGEPGIFPEVLEYLKTKRVNDAWQFKNCSLMIDGMAIRHHLDWDQRRKEHIGRVDLGDGPVKGTWATEALVFMAVGLIGGWKVPVGYMLIDCKFLMTPLILSFLMLPAGNRLKNHFFRYNF